MKIIGILIALFVFVVLLVGGGYVGASWLIGKQIAKQYPLVIQGVQRSIKGGNITVSANEFKSGLFHSTLRSQIVLTEAGNAELAKIACLTKLKHGPFLGTGFGLLESDSTCSLDKLNSVSFLTEKSIVGFDKNAKGTVNLPAMQQPYIDSDGSEVSFGGCESSYTYNHKSKEIESDGSCGISTFKDQKSSLVFNKSMIKGRSQILVNDSGDWVYPKGQVSIVMGEGINVSAEGQQVVVKNISLDSSNEQTDQLSQGQLKMTFESLVAMGQTFGPANLSISYQNLPVGGLKSLASGAMGDPASPQVQELLKSKPLLRLDELRLESKGEFVKLSASIDPSIMTVDGKLLLSSSFLKNIATLVAKSPDESAAMMAQADQQLQAMTQMGFLMQEGNQYKSDFQWSMGKFTVNGQVLPVPLESIFAGVMGGAQPPAPDFDPYAAQSITRPTDPAALGVVPQQVVGNPQQLDAPQEPAQTKMPVLVDNTVPQLAVDAVLKDIKQQPSQITQPTGPKPDAVEQQNFFKQDR